MATLPVAARAARAAASACGDVHVHDQLAGLLGVRVPDDLRRAEGGASGRCRLARPGRDDDPHVVADLQRSDPAPGPA